ncbi:hypothetical protein HAX54_015668, partial [Datura stramonium]|nr:hypothetical protein [Datura stramonium]
DLQEHTRHHEGTVGLTHKWLLPPISLHPAPYTGLHSLPPGLPSPNEGLLRSLPMFLSVASHRGRYDGQELHPPSHSLPKTPLSPAESATPFVDDGAPQKVVEVNAVRLENVRLRLEVRYLKVRLVKNENMQVRHNDLIPLLSLSTQLCHPHSVFAPFPPFP